MLLSNEHPILTAKASVWEEDTPHGKVFRGVKCENCGKLMYDGDWDFDELEHEPVCPCCHLFLSLPDGL